MATIKLSDEFWADPDLEGMASNEKLALIWLIGQADVAGFVAPNKRRYMHDTGDRPEILERALSRLGGSVQRVGRHLWLRNYIYYQHGRGEQLEKAGVSVAIYEAALARGDAYVDRLVERYPELRGVYQEGHASAAEAEDGLRHLAAQAAHLDAEIIMDRGRRDQAQSQEQGPPTREEVVAYAVARGWGEDCASSFYAHYASNLWRVFPHQGWRARLEGWFYKDATGYLAREEQKKGKKVRQRYAVTEYDTSSFDERGDEPINQPL